MILFQKKIAKGILRLLTVKLCLYTYGPGTVLLKHNNGECNKTLMLTRVYYAPHVSHCLLSITALTKQGFTCTIGDTTQIWDKTGNLVITAAQLNSSDTLRWFSWSPMQPDSNTPGIMTFSQRLKYIENSKQ